MRSLVSALRTRTPVPYVGRHHAGSGYSILASSGSEAQMKSMGSNGTLFAIVNKYAAAVASSQWHLYRKPTPGREQSDDRAEIFAHAALDLWNTPTSNSHYTRKRLIKTVQQHKELVGEGILVVVKLGSLPVELWPVRPDRMEPVPHPTEYLSGWIYHGPDGERVPLLPDQVVQMQQAPCPWDPYRGMGAVQTILTELHSARAAAEWNRAFFANSAEPGGVVEIDRRLSQNEFDELRKRWAEQHQGVNNAHRVAILEQVKWVPNAFSPRDMQFVELRGASSHTIREAFAFPKTMLGDIEDVNRASAEAEAYIFANWHTVPRLDDWRDELLNTRILPMYANGRSAEFDYDSPVPSDREADDRERTSTATAVATLVSAGFEPAEVLEWAGLPEMGHKPPPTPALPPGAPGAPGAKPPAADPEAPAPAKKPKAPKALAFGPAAAHRHGERLHLADEADADSDEPDLTGVLDDLVAALEQLEADYATVVEDQIDSLVEQVEAAVADDTIADSVAGLAAVAVPAALLGAGVARRAMDRLAASAARRAADEAAAQGVEVEQDDLDETVEEETAETGDVATVVVTLVAAGLAASAAREALRVWSPGASAREVGRKVRTHLEGLKGHDRKTAFGAMLHRATNLGRAAAFVEALKVRVGGVPIASERNDVNTCGPCSDWDGHRFATLAEAREMYDLGGYPYCKGRERCRGTYWVSWR